MTTGSIMRLGVAAALLAALAPATESLSSIKMTRPNQTVHAVGMGRANIPNVLVTDQHGRRHRFYDDLVKGKLILVNMFYAECEGICPRMTSKLQRIQAEIRKEFGDRLGKDIFIYSITLKPETDTLEKLEHYTEMHGIEPDSGWLLLRADRRNMELLRERLGFKESDVLLDRNIAQHTGMLRFGSDVYDKWSSGPLLGPADAILQGIRWIDLSQRRAGIPR